MSPGQSLASPGLRVPVWPSRRPGLARPRCRRCRPGHCASHCRFGPAPGRRSELDSRSLRFPALTRALRARISWEPKCPPSGASLNRPPVPGGPTRFRPGRPESTRSDNDRIHPHIPTPPLCWAGLTGSVNERRRRSPRRWQGSYSAAWRRSYPTGPVPVSASVPHKVDLPGATCPNPQR